MIFTTAVKVSQEAFTAADTCLYVEEVEPAAAHRVASSHLRAIFRVSLVL